MKPGGLESANQQALGVGALLCKKTFGVDACAKTLDDEAGKYECIAGLIWTDILHNSFPSKLRN